MNITFHIDPYETDMNSTDPTGYNQSHGAKFREVLKGRKVTSLVV